MRLDYIHYFFLVILVLFPFQGKCSGSYEINISDFSKELVIGQPSQSEIELVLDGEYPDLKKIMVQPKDRSQDQDIVISGNLPSLERIRLRSASGDITLTIKAKLPHLERVELLSTSGQLRLNIEEKLPEYVRVKLASTSGQININVKEGIGFELSTSSTSGKTYNNHPLVDSKSLNFFSRHKTYRTPEYLGQRFLMEATSTSANININQTESSF